MAVRPLQFQKNAQNNNKSIFQLVRQDKNKAKFAQEMAQKNRQRKFELLQEVQKKMLTINHNHSDYRLMQQLINHPNNKIQ
jgi:hypothetical protein